MGITQRPLPDEWQTLASRHGVRPSMTGISEASGVSVATVSRLVHEGRTSARTVEAVAGALGVQVDEIYRLAELASHEELGPWHPPKEAHMLPGAIRAELDDLIRAVARELAKGEDHGAGSGTEEAQESWPGARGAVDGGTSGAPNSRAGGSPVKRDLDLAANRDRRRASQKRT